MRKSYGNMRAAEIVQAASENTPDEMENTPKT